MLPDGAVLSLACAEANRLSINTLTVRFRRGGERCRPIGRYRSQTLKKLLQAYELEPWLRDRVPLIYRGGDLLGVGDLWVCHVKGIDTADIHFNWKYGLTCESAGM